MMGRRLSRAIALLLLHSNAAADELPAALGALLEHDEPPPPPISRPIDWSAPWQASSGSGQGQPQASQQPPLGTYEPERPAVEDTFAREERRSAWPPPPAAQPSAAADRIRAQAAAVASAGSRRANALRPAVTA